METQEQAFSMMLDHLEDPALLSDLSQVDRRWQTDCKQTALLLFGNAEPIVKLIILAAKRFFPGDVSHYKIPFNNSQDSSHVNEWAVLLENENIVKHLLQNQGAITTLLKANCFQSAIQQNIFTIDNEIVPSKDYTLFQRVFVTILLYIYYHNYEQDSKPHEDLMRKYADDLKRCHSAASSGPFIDLPGPNGRAPIFANLNQNEQTTKSNQIIEAFRKDLKKWDGQQ